LAFNPAQLDGEFPHKVVPRELEGNIGFRDELRRWLQAEGEDAEDRLMAWCRRDVLFFANALCWTLDSKRHPGRPVRPWISFREFQDDLFLELEDMWGPPDKPDQVGYDRCWVKVRDVGVSHIPLIAANRRFLCFSGQIFFFVSERAELVDDRADPGAMLPKIDFINSRLPTFMTREVKRQKLVFYYLDESGQPDYARGLLKGVATTDIATAATRPTSIIADEFGIWDAGKSIGFLASSSGASNSRLFMGTPKGQGGGFHKVATETEIPRTNIHWTQHPWHRRGLYHSDGESGPIVFEDELFWGHERFSWLQRTFPLLTKKLKIDDDALLRDCYPFVKDGKVRSPYYDHECARSPYAWQIAQEHDLDFHGSGSPFYNVAQLTTYIDRNAMVPRHRGNLTCDPYTFEPDVWCESESGDLLLWCELISDCGKLVPASRSHRCQIGVDVSAGTSASNSAISVWNGTTREKVGRWMRRDKGPDRLAEIAFTIACWFGGCNVIFEGGNHGSTFGMRFRELLRGELHPETKRPTLYWMDDRKGKRRPHPGLHYEGEGKLNLCANYGKALFGGEAMNRDREALKEGFNFQLGATELVEHVDTRNKRVAGVSKKNHGDAWMADCLAWHKVRGVKIDRRDPGGKNRSEHDEYTRSLLTAIEEKRYARSRW
jgi:hypothetical protein